MQSHVREQGRTPAGTHVPILLSETLEALAPQPGEVVVDCTLGYGGHAKAFLERVAPTGRVIGIDVDAAELAATKLRLSHFGDAFEAVCASFAGIERVLADLNQAGADVIFADLGVSSMQIDNPVRGFSYKHDGPLDMRMGPRAKRTAAEWLNRASPEEIAAALLEFGDESQAEAIAGAIVKRRGVRPLERTRDLVDAVHGASGSEDGAVARVFQAVRILVNDELAALRNLMRVIPMCLRSGGRVGIISFHSGEDRLVKQAMRRWQEAGMLANDGNAPITPSPYERRNNSRCTAARLRWSRKKESVGHPGCD